ncbi:PH domain-containing protein [Rhodococcus sp. Z13]|uniref:PH domain-containing protein n=1 Tax=Rhodococcus sacchari TaxID=2962047 RepID=A0ACD4DCU6_9NOCA|nr:PH domain-containing protein [Rhodococcus sp. Z13]UYP17856.1 PH domain-containing protein [Rhodococcus sp. Z13]
MGYPEDALAPEEELLLHRHPHWKALVLPALTFLFGTAVAGFLLGLIQARLDGAVSTWCGIVVAVLWIALVAWRCVPAFVRWLTTHFIVTDRRVLVRTGVITHSGIDIPMGRISNVQFRHGLVDRMLRTGTLVVVSAAEDPIEFDDIPDVQQVHALLYREAFDTDDRRDEHEDADDRTTTYGREDHERRKAW